MEWLAEWPADVSMVIESLAEFLVLLQLATLAVMIALLAVCSRPWFRWSVRRRRSFRCPRARRDVEVEFEERGLPGLRRSVAVLACSVYEPPHAIDCQRRCLDSAYRRQWEPALPIMDRGQP